MDVNGTNFHLIKSQEDWLTSCQPVDHDDLTGVIWDSHQGALVLNSSLPLFPRSPSDLPLTEGIRRGAAVDRFGNWYWISQNRKQIYWRPSGSKKSVIYWDQQLEQEAPSLGDFSFSSSSSEPVELAGLAVTENHYLVAGNVTESGLIVFDLHAGGPPIWLPFPDSVPFIPFDLSPAVGGGLWVLDCENRAYWGLDQSFRFISELDLISEDSSNIPGDFQPTDGSTTSIQLMRSVTGFQLPETTRPISIVGRTGNNVLVLDSPPGASFSTIHQYEFSQHLAAYPLEQDLEVVVLGQERRRQLIQIVGHDMAGSPNDETITVVERDGNQAVSLRLDENLTGIRISQDYLPLHTAGGRALVTGTEGLYYDVCGDAPSNDSVVRWVRLQTISRPYYIRSFSFNLGQPEMLTSPPQSIDGPAVFDGKVRDCVWHRLLLDACIPPETSVRVWTRAHNQRELIESLPFQEEPLLYLRGGGAELPFYNPYPEKKSLPGGTGTWELLFQEARGRYLQIKVELAGNGRVTPQLRALRVYYPRFSYPHHFLPQVYVDESRPGPFLERLLANMEGFFTDIEGKIGNISLLFDPRSTPPEALDWLASWMGLLMDPLWSRIQRERQAYIPGMSRIPDRRRFFIRFARKLYERRGTTQGINFALQLLLEPCLEVMLDRLKDAAVGHDDFVRTELIGYDLIPPTSTTSESTLEDILYEWVLRRPSQLRLVENFLIRRGRGRVEGDPTATDAIPEEEDFSTYAHQFTVLIPMEISLEEEMMIRRVVNLEKPAHTTFSLRRYWEGFRIDEARLGLDTTLDRTNRFVSMLLGRDYVSSGYVDADHPMDVSQRIISDRDRLGNMPAM